MTRNRKVALVCFAWLLPVAAICRADTFAVVVGGINKDPADRAAQEKTVTDLQAYLLTKVKVRPERLRMLTSGVEAALDNLAGLIGPQDRLIFWYVGQANAAAGKLRFNLAGPDLTNEDLAKHLTPIKAGSILIALDCPNAALAVKTLSGPGRVILCASKEDQPFGTQLTRHFLPALASAQSDTDKDGKVSVLEAFAAAAMRIEQSYRNQQILPTETPCLDDNGDGVPSEHPWRRSESTDGIIASRLFLDL
jgi:hypothetical protein